MTPDMSNLSVVGSYVGPHPVRPGSALTAARGKCSRSWPGPPVSRVMCGRPAPRQRPKPGSRRPGDGCVNGGQEGDGSGPVPGGNDRFLGGQVRVGLGDDTAGGDLQIRSGAVAVVVFQGQNAPVKAKTIAAPGGHCSRCAALRSIAASNFPPGPVRPCAAGRFSSFVACLARRWSRIGCRTGCGSIRGRPGLLHPAGCARSWTRPG